MTPVDGFTDVLQQPDTDNSVIIQMAIDQTSGPFLRFEKSQAVGQNLLC